MPVNAQLRRMFQTLRALFVVSIVYWLQLYLTPRRSSHRLPLIVISQNATPHLEATRKTRYRALQNISWGKTLRTLST